MKVSGWCQVRSAEEIKERGNETVTRHGAGSLHQAAGRRSRSSRPKPLLAHPRQHKKTFVESRTATEEYL